MLVSVSVPTLISGVSQQPPALRLSTTAERMINAWPSVISGLNKRPPTEHIANLGFTASSSVIMHVIDRGTDYNYVVTIADGDIKVFDTDGVAKTVNKPNGVSYLSQAVDPVNDLRFITFADTTFILNRRVDTKVDKYREASFTGLTLTGTVALYSSLAVAGAGNVSQIYKVSSENQHYQSQVLSSTAAINGWVRQDAVNYLSPPGGEPNGTSFPAVMPAVGSEFYLYVYVLISGVYRWRYHYYKVAVTTPSAPSSYGWVAINPAELVASADGRLNPLGRGTVYIVNSVSNVYYNIYVGGVLKGSFLSANGVDAANALQSTEEIASQLAADLTTNSITNTRVGSTICITGIGSSELVVTATNGDKAIRAYTDAISSFSDLPPNEAQGRVVKVKGDVKNNGDDYYVIYDSGLWEETYAYGLAERLQASTMPHVLVRNTDGTWTFKEHTWAEKVAGDEDSNPSPSFINYKLSDMFLYTSRLGFITEDNIILSEANVFENFYRVSIVTLLDADRVDISVLSAMNDTLRHAVAFNKDLLILGDRSQHRMTYQNFVGPKTIQVQFTTSFNVSPDVHPINMGGSVHFVDDKVGYTFAKAFEYFPKPNLQGDDAEETTAPIPQFIPSGVTFLAGSPRVNCMVAGSTGYPSRLYFHKFYWAGERKVQNSWSYWEFSDAISVHYAAFNKNKLFVIIKRTNGTFLEVIRLDEDLFNYSTQTSRVMLDRLVAPTSKVHSAGVTTIVLPYASTGNMEALVAGERKSLTRTNTTTFTLVGDYSASTMWCGLPYTFTFEFSRPYVRYQKGQGEVVSQDNRLMLRYIMLEYHDTPYFKTEIVNAQRPNRVQTYEQLIMSGTMKIAVLGNHMDTRLSLTNDSPFNCSFGTAEWWAQSQPRAKRT